MSKISEALESNTETSKAVQFLGGRGLVSDERKDVFISDQIGTVKIKPLGITDLEDMKRRCTDRKSGNLDIARLSVQIVADYMVEPVFDKDFLEKQSKRLKKEFMCPADYIREMFFFQEINAISGHILEFGGCDSTIQEDVEAIKK